MKYVTFGKIICPTLISTVDNIFDYEHKVTRADRFPCVKVNVPV